MFSSGIKVQWLSAICSYDEWRKNGESYSSRVCNPILSSESLPFFTILKEKPFTIQGKPQLLFHPGEKMTVRRNSVMQTCLRVIWWGGESNSISSEPKTLWMRPWLCWSNTEAKQCDQPSNSQSFTKREHEIFYVVSRIAYI